MRVPPPHWPKTQLSDSRQARIESEVSVVGYYLALVRKCCWCCKGEVDPLCHMGMERSLKAMWISETGPPIEIGRLISCQKSRLFMLMSRHFYQFVLVLVSLVSCHLLVPTVRYHGPCTNYWATITVGRNCSRCIRSGIKEKGWTSSRLNMLLPLSSVPDSVARRTEAAKYTALQHCQIRWLFL